MGSFNLHMDAWNIHTLPATLSEHANSSMLARQCPQWLCILHGSAPVCNSSADSCCQGSAMQHSSLLNAAVFYRLLQSALYNAVICNHA